MKISENFTIIPIFHSRINFAKRVSEVFNSFNPDVIAIELPGDLKDKVISAVKRLPYLSVVGYIQNDILPDAHVIEHGDVDGNLQYDLVFDKVYTFVPIHPGDGIVESIRLGLENGKEIEFIDLNIDDDTEREKVPDDHVYELLEDHDRIEELLMSHLSKSDVNSKSYERELFMASKLQDLMLTGKRILAVVGFAHLSRIKEMIEQNEKVMDYKYDKHEVQEIFNVFSCSSEIIIEEIPYFEYLYELWRILERGDYEGDLVKDLVYSKFLFYILLDKFHSEMDSNGDMNPGKILEKIEDFAAHYKDDDRWTRVLKKTTELEIKILRRKKFSRQVALTLLFSTTNLMYEQYYLREPIRLLESRFMMQYLRNWSFLQDRLFPTFPQVVIAAKNFSNDEYAGILFDNARLYPFIDLSNELKTIFHGPYLKIKDKDRLFLRSRYPTSLRSWRSLPIKRKPKERYPGEWNVIWNKNFDGFCSFPPEDKVEEEYFGMLRRKTQEIIENRRTKIQEFKSSLLDGIDYRETIRYRPLKKIFVKELLPIYGRVGSVVVIFDKDTNDRRFPNKITWWAEHDKESDMAFYSTLPEHNLIGPGIARVEVGGLVSIYPPKHIPPIWPYYEVEPEKLKKYEILIKAAIEFSSGKYIPYIAKDPPLRRHQIAALESGKVLIHIPFWRLNNDSLNQIKYLHILKQKKIRDIARDYIFL
ncbi:MAG: hypothetical protein ACTSVI_14740 [Promethearchaeota archaeon]